MNRPWKPPGKFLDIEIREKRFENTAQGADHNRIISVRKPWSKQPDAVIFKKYASYFPGTMPRRTVKAS
jgi:hypothetical protein